MALIKRKEIAAIMGKCLQNCGENVVVDLAFELAKILAVSVQKFYKKGEVYEMVSSHLHQYGVFKALLNKILR